MSIMNKFVHLHRRRDGCALLHSTVMRAILLPVSEVQSTAGFDYLKPDVEHANDQIPSGVSNREALTLEQGA